MYNPNNYNEIVFPHTFGGNVLLDKQYTWNDCHGGAATPEKLGLVRHDSNVEVAQHNREVTVFFGGKCQLLGFIPELGFYGCLNKRDPSKMALCGFHVQDPTKVTEMGKQALAARYPQRTINYVTIDTVERKTEDPVVRQKVVAAAVRVGVDRHAIENAKTASIKSLTDAKKFEKKQVAKAETTQVVAEGDSANDLLVKASRKRAASAPKQA